VEFSLFRRTATKKKNVAFEENAMKIDFFR